jgi:hypothetical protein
MNFRIFGSGAVVAAILIALTVSVAWAAATPIDDPYSTANSQWNGTSTLLALGVKPVKSNFQRALSTPATPSIVLILGPIMQFTTAEADGLAAYLRNGGRLVLADNIGSGNQLLALLGLPVRFDGRLLVDTLFYTTQPIFPTVVDFTPSDLTSGVAELALNYATVLNITNTGTVRILATSTPFSFLSTNRNGKLEPGEPTGPFPVLAEIAVGKGSVILFSSPASFTNGMLNMTDNTLLLQNILKTAPPGNALIDESHLTPSPFTPTKEMAQEIVTGIWNGGMLGSIKLGLTVLIVGVLAARYGYRRPSKKQRKGTRTGPRLELDDVDSILKLHPTWSRERLEYVKRELDVTRKWRRLGLEEE